MKAQSPMCFLSLPIAVFFIFCCSSWIINAKIMTNYQHNYKQHLRVFMFDKNYNSSILKQNFELFNKLFKINNEGSHVEFNANKGLKHIIQTTTNENSINVINILEEVGSDNNFDICTSLKKLAEQYNSSLILWPCPSMEISNNPLPSLVSISYAVKSIAEKLNWSKAVILVTDENWGLALALVENLNIPYRIKLVTTDLQENEITDERGKVVILTSALNNPTTLNIILSLSRLNYSKVLLIDILGVSFDATHQMFMKLQTAKYSMNILILTILNDRLRQLLALMSQDKKIDLVQNFKQWKHFDDSKQLKLYLHENSCLSNGSISDLNETLLWKMCKSFEDLKLTCKNGSLNELKRVCSKFENSYNILSITKINKNEFGSISHEFLSILIKYFHFFDFLSSILENNEFHKCQFDFIVLDITRKNITEKLTWRPMLILEENEIDKNKYTSHSVIPGYNRWLLENSQTLWYCGLLCGTIITIVIFLLLLIVAASVTAVIFAKNYLMRKRLSKGPNKIVLSSDDFVFPVDTRRVDEGIEAMLCCWLQQLKEFGGPEVDKPDLLKGSIGSLKNLGLVSMDNHNSGSESIARHNTIIDTRARYNGDLVHLKEIPSNNSLELKSRAMDLLVIAHGLRHENINPLIGWLGHPSRTAIVFDYCSRGSLQDVLIMDEIKLDWSFRLSLLTDLVRGMRYLHSSPVEVHGALSSRNCVVDARWVLKVTDYGLPEFYEAQGINPPSKCAKELLWTSPELLRSYKGHNKYCTKMADIYSFGIIMQEVVVRGEPYCMLSLSPEEIITKLKKPPPLIRPSVSKGAAPPEAINIMRQCWAENPEMRPDFNSVYERFKLLNHGRKVNFVDTMFQMLEKYSNNLEELIKERTEQLDIERKKTEQLLNRMLPSSVAEKLKMGLTVDPEEFSDVTIYFSDIVGFTTIAAHCSPVQVVDLLNDLYTIFDDTINAYNVYKVETIGDAYMVVSGLPVRIPDHVEQIATMALDLLYQSGRFQVKHLPGVPLQLRIGLHTGPCCAGVVGLTMPRYCLFGDTVNTASRMESAGSPWRIHLSEVTRNRLAATGNYDIEPRGPVEIKGKGLMNTYWLLGKKGFHKALPDPPPDGLDESLIKDSIRNKALSNNKARNITNPSSSQSSITGEVLEVKVEITPPAGNEYFSHNSNSYSMDSGKSSGVNLATDGQNKIFISSPQQRKLSELSQDGFLNSNTVGKLHPSSSNSGSSSKLYKRIEEMMDLSLPYNHYKCLSPSENNLLQFYDGKFIYGTSRSDSKPGSSRLLRRQFSLDKDDLSLQTYQDGKQTLDIPVLQETRFSPTNLTRNQLSRLHKQNSSSIAQDLEKIEEIPLSPLFSLSPNSSEKIVRKSISADSGTPLEGQIDRGTSNRPSELCLNIENLFSR